MCEGTLYFHLDEDGLPVCGPASTDDVETWEIQDWPDREPEPVSIESLDARLAFSGVLRASPRGCSTDVDAFTFTLAPGLPRFVEARARLTRPNAEQIVQMTSAVPSESSACFGGPLSAEPVLLFAGAGATLLVEHVAVDAGGSSCPRGGVGAGYTLELELRGEASIVDLGRVDASRPSARASGTPSQLHLYSIEAEPGAALRVRTWDPEQPSTTEPPRFLRVDPSSGAVEYVAEAVWLAQTESRRYFEVWSCWSHVVEVTLGS